MKLTDFKVLTFDCYGTLIDWERGILQHLRPLTERLGQRLTDDAILEAYGRHEALEQQRSPKMPYRELVAGVYKQLASEFGMAVSREECVAFGSSIGQWPAFQDSASVLQYLQKHFKLVVITNIDNASFSESNKKLGVEFDAVYTAEEIGSYKPDLRNFDYLLAAQEAKGFGNSQILHVAESLYHDHVPANKMGIASCWIYRRFDKPGFGVVKVPDELPTYKFQFNSLADFAKAHQNALRS